MAILARFDRNSGWTGQRFAEIAGGAALGTQKGLLPRRRSGRILR